MTGVLKTIGSGSKPMTNVSVSGIPPGNATVSDAEGRFRLEFPQQKLGDVVRIQVTRAGWEVINAFELNRTLSDDPDPAVVKLYLCERDRLEGLARWFLRELSDEAIEAT